MVSPGCTIRIGPEHQARLHLSAVLKVPEHAKEMIRWVHASLEVRYTRELGPETTARRYKAARRTVSRVTERHRFIDIQLQPMATEAAESSSTPWDTSTGNRFAHYSSEDHSAPLWIAAILSFTYVLGMLLVRTFLKWRVFGWDDFLVVFSTVSVSQVFQWISC